MNGQHERLYLATSNEIAQRASTVLKDVRYVINAHFELTDQAGESDTEEKFYNMILRRLKKGQCFHRPYLGTREFACNFKLYEGDQASYYSGIERDLGMMLYDLDYGEEIKPYYFKAVMKDGVIKVSDSEVYR